MTTTSDAPFAAATGADEEHAEEAQAEETRTDESHAPTRVVLVRHGVT